MSAIARRGFIKGAAAAGLAVAGIGAPRAQDAGGAWPNRPVRFIVPLAPGGAIDFIARALGDVMSRSIGQQVVVENRTGAGGTIGMDMALKSAPDGYTVLITNDNAASAPHIMNLSYDYTKELVPVIYLARQSQILATHRSLGVGTVAELVDHVKANPGMGYATSGVGTNQHVIGEWFKQTAGLKLDHVPYRGGAPQVTDLLAGHALIGFTQVQGALEHVRGGRLNAILTTGAQRARAVPELPTFAELGYPELTAAIWFGLLMKTGTPADVVGRIEAAGRAAHADAGVRARLEEQGFEVSGLTGPAFKAGIDAQFERWARIVKATGFSAD